MNDKNSELTAQNNGEASDLNDLLYSGRIKIKRLDVIVMREL